MRKVIIPIIFLLKIVEAYSYDFTTDFKEGIYWSSFPLRVTLFALNSLEGEQLHTLVNQAQGQWEDVIGQEVWDVEDGFHLGEAYSGNTIRWSEHFSEDTGYSSASTLAVTIRHRVGPYFTRFEIILNGEKKELREDRDHILYKTILHELGHTIGLDHSEYPFAIMYASLQRGNYFSYDDEDGFRALVDEIQTRQEKGHISKLSSSNEKSSLGNALACGSLLLVDSDANLPPPGGTGAALLIFGGVLSLFMGFAMRKWRTFWYYRVLDF